MCRITEVSEACELACIVEAGTFKPGNVYYGRKGFFDFVVSAVVLRKSVARMCREEVELGRFIKEAVTDRRKVVAGNTNFGIIVLCVPLAVAASRRGDLGRMVDKVVHSSTVRDAVEFAEAVRVSGAYLGEPERGPDLRVEKGVQEIEQSGDTLLDLFLISAGWDSIASEWVNGFSVTFSGAEQLLSGKSVVQVYMEILAAHPDSLVQRRFGKEIAKEVSDKAKELLNDFSLDELKVWDRYLFEKGINPGTTADLVASSIFVALLKEKELIKRLLHEM
jgi:triphosphoribosyl-dephospho-CoA synthase